MNMIIPLKELNINKVKAIPNGEPIIFRISLYDIDSLYVPYPFAINNMKDNKRNNRQK